MFFGICEVPPLQNCMDKNIQLGKQLYHEYFEDDFPVVNLLLQEFLFLFRIPFLYLKSHSLTQSYHFGRSPTLACRLHLLSLNL